MELNKIVKIDIKDPTWYTSDLYKSINGKTGVILAYKEYERKYGVFDKALLDVGCIGQWWIPKSHINFL